MSQGTDPSQPALATTRAQWRDAVKRSRLKPVTRFVALLMADYWPKDGGELWCAIDHLAEEYDLGRSTLYAAIRELEMYGWLIQTAPHRQHRSPRYLPVIGAQAKRAKRSKTRTPESDADDRQRDPWEPQRSETRNPEVPNSDKGVRDSDPTPQDSSTDSTRGSSDQDSRRGPQQDANRPHTAAETRDRDRLAKYMTNYAQSVDFVWAKLREGITGTDIDTPGKFAASKHRLPTATPGVSEWQGIFSRYFHTADGHAPYPTVDPAVPGIKAA